MNAEKIEALARQAGFCGDDDLSNTQVGTTRVQALTNFAELIVRECIDKIRGEQGSADQNWQCKNGVHIAWELKNILE